MPFYGIYFLLVSSVHSLSWPVFKIPATEGAITVKAVLHVGTNFKTAEEIIISRDRETKHRVCAETLRFPWYQTVIQTAVSSEMTQSMRVT